MDKEEQKKKWREYYEKNKEEINRKRSERAKLQRETENGKHRDWYARNKELNRLKEIERRKKRNPTHGLFATISAFQRGDINLAELNRSIDRTLVGVAKLDPRKRNK